MDMTVEAEVSALVRKLYPGARAVSVELLRPDASGGAGDTQKASGYGEPLRLRIVDAGGADHDLVLHTATSNDFGHDRRADRAEEALLAYDTFGGIPRHVRAVDVGAVGSDGNLISLRDSGEFYLVTEYTAGAVYAADLQRIAKDGTATADDLSRVSALALYLAEVHVEIAGRPGAYRRAIRDLVGHGECIFGIVDSYGPEVPQAPPERLFAIERSCLEWRWRLRDRTRRLCRTHGDFHPFNVVFQEGVEFRVLDASRGSVGDPADDVAAMAINFPFFALAHPGSWRRGLGLLWHRFFETCLASRGDAELFDVLPPFLAFRGLVVANPIFYPGLAAGDRDRLLGFVERALASTRFDPASADALFG